MLKLASGTARNVLTTRQLKLNAHAVMIMGVLFAKMLNGI